MSPRNTSGPPDRSRSIGKREDAVTIAGIELTHPERPLFVGQGVTKRRLAQYYETVGERMLAHLENRAVSLVRCPTGTDGECFYQKHPGAGLSKAIAGVMMPEKDGSDLYLVVRELRDVILLVQYGALEFHPWGCRVDRPDRPDRLIFDLDPGAGVEWSAVQQGAREVRRRLDVLGLQSYLRTTGGKGLHVVAPLERRNAWHQVFEFAKAVASSLASEVPDRYTVEISKRKRQGKVFVDTLRNARGATAIASYSTRARPGAPVATPLGWDELESVHGSDAFDLQSVEQRLAEPNPWEGFFDQRQSITNARLLQARSS